MKLGYALTLAAVFCFGFASFSGCEAPTNDTASHDGDHDHDHGDHDHDHDHGDHDHSHDGELPAHGPSGGHLFKLEGTDLVGEWVHYNDNDIIRVYLMDLKEKNAIPCDGVKIIPTAGDDKTPFVLELDPEKNKGDQKLVYMLDNKNLMLAMNLGVKVEITVGDEVFKGKIAPHAPHDH